jgi:phytoene dehydrogenase-like protein
MTKTFEQLGGKLLLKTRVKKVMIENGAATGVILEKSTLSDISKKLPAENGLQSSEDIFLPADAVIVTQETIAAVNQLFDKPLKDKWINNLCKHTKPVVCTFVCVGIRAELPQILSWEFEEPIRYADETVSKIGFYNYSEYEGYAPKGCTALTTVLTADTYDFWKRAKEEDRYEDEKQNLANQVVRVICEKYPQAEGNIEVIEVATPLTYERYTGAYHGSWMSVVNVGDKMKIYPGLLKSVKGLYFAGHRMMTPGGLPVAIDSGRKAAQMVCRQFNVTFK